MRCLSNALLKIPSPLTDKMEATKREKKASKKRAQKMAQRERKQVSEAPPHCSSPEHPGNVVGEAGGRGGGITEGEAPA